MPGEHEETAIEQYEPREESLAEFDFATTDPLAALEKAQEVVQWMHEKCKGPQYVSNIQGRSYPRVDWWTTVGMGLGLFPREASSKRFEIDERNYGYEAVIEVCRNGIVITRASAICTTLEKSWGNRDEYAVKSMATTRATGKAYRIGLSGLAVMAGLEPTPAEEIPPQGFDNRPSETEDRGHGICPEHKVAWFQTPKMRSPAHPVDGGKWCNKPDVPDGGFMPPETRQPKREKSQFEIDATEMLANRFHGEKVLIRSYVIDILGKDVLPSQLSDRDWETLYSALSEDALDAKQVGLDGELHDPLPSEKPDVTELDWNTGEPLKDKS